MDGVTFSDDIDIEDFARRTEGYSGADVANVCRDAAMMGVRRVMAAVREKGLDAEAMQKALVENQVRGWRSGAARCELTEERKREFG